MGARRRSQRQRTRGPDGGDGRAAMTVSATMPAATTAAFVECERIARAHYENFTLGSRLLPRHLRRHIAAIYAFARTADDLADEEASPERALAGLDAWERELEACYAGTPCHPIFVALADTVRTYAIPIEPFRRLLAAFRMDARFAGFETFADLRRYCAHSANPVGHLVLYLFGYGDAERQALADDICTALQLTNFWQDLAVDLRKGRIYLPREDMARFGYGPDDLQRQAVTAAFRELMTFQCARTRGFFTRGLALASLLDRSRAREIRLFAAGGLAILDRLEAVGYDAFSARPTLSRWVKMGLVARALVGGAA
ncbi:MAG: squalene synthase HpnC [Polyangiaceae bacterium UTPRO1]|nr:MAG: squalene synthase HpnC [Polyangiaceae bacterium UTPRO1]